MAVSDARAARERKQKIFVLVGGVALLALVAFQLPRILSSTSSPSAAPAAEAPSAEFQTTVPSATPTSVVLVDTDRRLAPAPGKLRTFTVFSRKDPFIQQVVSPTPGSVGSTTKDGGQTATKTASKGFTVGGKPAAAVTLISVNGVRQALVPGGAFPAVDPVFVLVAEQPDAKTVTIGVAGGAYANGSKTTKLEVGKPLVLVNTTTRARYRIVLVAVGNGSASSPDADETPSPEQP